MNLKCLGFLGYEVQINIKNMVFFYYIEVWKNIVHEQESESSILTIPVFLLAIPFSEPRIVLL